MKTLKGIEARRTLQPAPAAGGVVGNGETLAVVAGDGRITWWCIPRFDAYPVFSQALDPGRGGSLEVRAGGVAEPAGQAYWGASNVLVTRVRTPLGDLAFVDYAPWGTSALVREVWAGAPLAADVRLQVTRARVAGRWTRAPKTPGDGPGAEIRAQGAVLAIEAEGAHLTAVDVPGALVALRAAPESEPGAWAQAARGSGRKADGSPLLESLRPQFRLLMSYGSAPAATRAAARSARQTWAEKERQADLDWLSVARWPEGVSPAHRALFERSALVLRLLTHSRTGAILAAGTASWPATPGGGDNWDYRYTWLRDGAWTAHAFDLVGLHRESRAFLRQAFEMQGPDGHWQQPLYAIDGQLPEEHVATELQGPLGERPIRFGNAAAHQLQLDGEGNVLFAAARHIEATDDGRFLWENWGRIRSAARWIERNWTRPESGIWELRGETAHWLFGKVMAAVGLRSAARLARRLSAGSTEARRWDNVASVIVETAHERAWSERRQAFMRLYRDDGPGEGQPLDISVLAGLLWEEAGVTGERMRSTLAAINRPASAGGLLCGGEVLRFGDGALPFYMAGFWLARAFIRAGQRREGLELFERLSAGGGHLGLLAEHHDPGAGRQVGNFPQAFSHEEQIQTLVAAYEGG